jgi:F-type H+-transporting ATPase subunit b
MRVISKASLLAPLAVAAGPAFAAGEGKPFFSLANTDFVVLIGFLIFIGILVYFNIPGLLGGMLDKRANDIQSEIDEARAIREEAQALLASYERQQKDVQRQADNIVAAAKAEASAAADKAKEDLKVSIARRMAAAEDQLNSAEAAAVKDVRDRAAAVAVEVAQEVIAGQLTAKDGAAMIDDAIANVGSRLQ